MIDGTTKSSIFILYSPEKIKGVSVMAKTDLKPTPNFPIKFKSSFFVEIPSSLDVVFR